MVCGKLTGMIYVRDSDVWKCVVVFVDILPEVVYTVKFVVYVWIG